MNQVLVATLIQVAMPNVLMVLLPDVALPARYKVTPEPCATVMLPVPWLIMVRADPVWNAWLALLAMVRIKLEAEVE